MFRHRESRTLVHNLKLASLLSFVAGAVNACGFLSVGYLTTNITGHFASIGNTLLMDDHSLAFTALSFVMAFFAGAFFTSFLMESRARVNANYMGIIPVSIECLILTIVAFLPSQFFEDNALSIALTLLFCMGMQNALVTNISNSIVRTTHLTGLFTDLGIELAQLFFYVKKPQQKRLLSSIKLHFSIITFFFMGLIIGGWLYMHYNKRAFLLASVLLIIGMLYGTVKSKMIKLKNRISS